MLDPSLNFIISALQTSNRPSWQDVSEKSPTVKTLWRMWDRLSLEKGYLTRLWFEGQQCVSDQLIVPSHSKSDVLYHFHDIPSGGHLGAEKTLGKIRQTFYWPNIKDDVEKYCSKCTLCAARKKPKPAKSPLGSNVVLAPMERIAVDILGPLPKTESGNTYVLVICDCYTRWTEAVPLPNQEARTVAKAFVDNFFHASVFPSPSTLIKDATSLPICSATCATSCKLNTLFQHHYILSQTV